MAPGYEIEIKTLLGAGEAADGLRAKMIAVDPATRLTGKSKQLNHYFVGGDMRALYDALGPLLSYDERQKMKRIIKEGKNFSVRTRRTDTATLFVVKASIDDTTSENGISRVQFETPTELSLGELDGLLLSAGFSYQAKWSREREEYACRGITVCLDKNAGYGYMAEFEKMIDDAADADAARQELRDMMRRLEVEELAQDRLERMFAHYNDHWQEYYGTDKVFIIE